MPTRTKPLLAALVPALVLACALTGAPPEPRTPGALDRILVGEKSDEAGSFVFPHRRHYGPASEGGRAIPCGRCHHDYRGPGMAR